MDYVTKSRELQIQLSIAVMETKRNDKTIGKRNDAKGKETYETTKLMKRLGYETKRVT